MNKKTYLIDGSGYIFRAYYAVAPLSTAAGLPTNALFGFSRMLLKLLRNIDSEQIVMIFDAGAKTFRNDLYPEYKANRGACPDDLVPQMPYFREISKALGLKVLEQPGFEADDLIGTLAKKIGQSKEEVVVISADKDLMQLVDDNISVYDPMKDHHFQREEVKGKFGVYPEQLIDYLALVGDSSDNIPGLPGVGPKTAVALLQEYQTLDNILKSTEAIAENKKIRGAKKLAEKIVNDPDLIRVCKELVTIKLDCPIYLDQDEASNNLTELELESLNQILTKQAPDADLLTDLSDRLEFSDLFKELAVASEPAKEVPKDYRTVYAAGWPEFLIKLKQQKEFSFDLETTAINTLAAEIVGVAFCFDNTIAYYLPIAHLESKEDQLSAEKFISDTKDIFEDAKIKKVGQNLKYDLGVLANYNVQVQGISFDTMLAAYLLDPDNSSFNLGALSLKYLKLRASEYKDTIANTENNLFSEVAIAEATNYAAEDAHYAWLLTEVLRPLIEAENLNTVLNQLELPLISILSEIERTGLLVDLDFLAKFSEELAEHLQSLTRQITELAGEEFNLNSPKQLSYILFDKLGLPTKGLKKTKTGVSTNAATLEKLQYHHPLPETILEYRELFKLQSTYVEALPKYVDQKTLRLHTSLNQTITATGRLSSSSPNLQNIPVQGEGRKIRKAFIADSGNVLISADYSQIELRVLAHLSNDQNLIKAFEADLDVHAETARQILEIPVEDEVTSAERRIGKTLNFGLIYGMSAFRLAGELQIPMGEAKTYMDNYFELYSGIKKYFTNLEEQLEKDGYVATIFGRKRYINSIDTSGRDKGFLIRAALNAPVQGSAADIIKLAMIKVRQRIKAEMPEIKILLQIHDELLFEVSEEKAEAARQLIVEEMEQPLKGVLEFAVPLKVSAEIGRNWDEIH